MTTYDINSGNTESLTNQAGQVGETHLLTVTGDEVTVSTVKRYSDEGVLIEPGDRVLVHLPARAQLWADATGSSTATVRVTPMGVNSLGPDDDLEVDFGPRTELSGEIQISEGGDVVDVVSADARNSLLTQSYITQHVDGGGKTLGYQAGLDSAYNLTTVHDGFVTILARALDTIATDSVHVGGSTITDSTTGTGSGAAASLNLGSQRSTVDVWVDASGSASLTVEVSEDGGTTWREYDTVSYGSASDTPAVEGYDVAFADIRAYLDQNTNRVVVSGKGV